MSRALHRSFGDDFHAAVDALLSGGAFTDDYGRLQYFTDEAGDSPTSADFREAAKYVGRFLTSAGHLNVRTVTVSPVNNRWLSIEVVRIIRTKPDRFTRQYRYRQRRFETTLDSGPVRVG